MLPYATTHFPHTAWPAAHTSRLTTYVLRNYVLHEGEYAVPLLTTFCFLYFLPPTLPRTIHINRSLSRGYAMRTKDANGIPSGDGKLGGDDNRSGRKRCLKRLSKMQKRLFEQKEIYGRRFF